MITRNKIKSPLYQLALVLIGLVCFTSCVIDETDNYLPSTSKRIGFSAGEAKSKSATGSRAMLGDNTPTLHLQATEGEQSLDVVTTDGINVRKGTASPATRGTQTFTTGAWDYRVVAYYYPESGSPMNFFLQHQEGIEINSDSGEYATNYYWPGMGEMEFFAVAPSSIALPTTPAKNPTITYTIPNNVAQQQDVMVAHPAVVDCTEEQPAVGLQFDHLLAAVQFKAGKMLAVRINSLSISGVKGGTINMTYNPSTDSWNYSGGSNTTYNIITTTDGTPSIDTYGMTEGSYITSNDNGMTMLVMPQSLNGATVNISYTEQLTQTTHTISIPLSGTWEAGKTTTYVLNIEAETLHITIPTPPDADAHYVRVDMPYDLSGLKDFVENKGFTLSAVTATAVWLDEGDSSADKRHIGIKTELTEKQAEGYFTDQEWTTTINNGTEVGPKLTNSNLLGNTTTQVENNSSGTFYLFLDENNGTVDRIGKLTLTATISGGGTSRPITIASGEFKQLCPSWNNSGLGVERFEESNLYTYGFFYNRSVVYTNTRAEGYLNLDGWLQAIARFLMWLFGLSSDTALPDIDEDIAPGFVIMDKETDSFGQDIVKSITINYGALNKVDSIANSDNGLINTNNLYDFTGNTDITELETQLDDALLSKGGWTKVPDDSANPEYYAAYMALTRNRMREHKTVITVTGQDPQTIVKAILHRENEGNGTNGVNESGAEIIEWYLPSLSEAQTLKETGTGSESTPISPLHGTYWSSTAGDNPPAGDGHGFAASYSYANNSYTNYNAQQQRTEELKVRAVRKR